MTPEFVVNLDDALRQLAALMQEADALAAPYDVQIQAIEIAKADALSSLTFQIETLKASLRPYVLAEGQTQRVNGLTASVVQKEVWDDALLRTCAVEMPAVLQCLRDASYVVFRYRSRK